MRISRQIQQGLSGLQRALRAQPYRPLTSFSRSLYSQSIRSPLSQRQPTPFRPSISVRYNSTRDPSPLTDRQASPTLSEEEKAALEERRKNEPAYQITFTCKPCQTRSSHRMSKHGYHKGTVLISCPSCNNRHVISDHLNIFMDKSTTLEDILKEKGQVVTKGTLEGDTEFWEDGTVRSSEKSSESASPSPQLSAGNGQAPSS
jgi:protein import protein ZIM17